MGELPKAGERNGACELVYVRSCIKHGFEQLEDNKR